MITELAQVERAIFDSPALWLFLDYDGTLANFAPTPDHVEPDPRLIALITLLANNPLIHTALISGRRLDQIETLLPVPGLILAGTYGLEMRLADGSIRTILDYQEIRPSLEDLKPQLSALLTGKQGFFLEDKGWSLALHARFAKLKESEEVLTEARLLMQPLSGSQFRLMGGDRFLEISPTAANKGHALEWLFHQFPLPRAYPVMVGDDDKDEEAFLVTQRLGGAAIVVASQERQTNANARLETPQTTQDWLERLARHFDQRAAVIRASRRSDAHFTDLS